MSYQLCDGECIQEEPFESPGHHEYQLDPHFVHEENMTDPNDSFFEWMEEQDRLALTGSPITFIVVILNLVLLLWIVVRRVTDWREN